MADSFAEMVTMEIKKIHPLTRMFIFCAGSSSDVLMQCPRSEWIKHAGIGVTVFFTGLLAVLSSFYAFQLVFHHAGISLPLSILWGAIIFNLDRYIVSSFRMNQKPLQEFFQAVPRILMAIGIAIVISKPLELEIFKAEIQQSLQGSRITMIDSLTLKHENELKAWDMRIAERKLELKGYFDMKEAYYQDYRCECDGTCGTGKQGRGIECISKKEKYESFSSEFQQHQLRIEKVIAGIEQEKKVAATAFAENRKTIDASFSFGFLARLNALSNLDSMATLAITLLLALIEITPVLTKIFATKGPYDHLIQMGEYAFKVKYIQSVYQQNQELYQSAQSVTQQPAGITQTSPNFSADDATDESVRDRYRKLKDNIKNNQKS